MKRQYRSKKNGFTLIEMVIAIAVLSILVALAVPQIMAYIDNAKITVDKTSVKTLNSATSIFRLNTSKPDVFEDESKQNEDLMQELVQEGLLGQAVIPQTRDAAFEWNFQDSTWLLSVDDTPIPLSPLGSSFAEVSSGMISLIIQRYETVGKYGRTFGDYTYTDIGLDPLDWQDPILHIYYKPGGSTLRIRPEEGYVFIVDDIYGQKRTLKTSYNWDLIYSDLTKKWYYHAISNINEIVITTMMVSAQI